jgi:predicted small integral membrane protein
MIIRCAKIALVLGVGLFAGLAAFTNLTITEVTLGAVRGAVGMGDVVQHPNVQWRAVESTTFSAILFWMIVLAEVAGGMLCFLGSYRLWRVRSAPASGFNEAKSLALAGLAVITLLYLVGFLAILSEWFVMWSTQGLNVLPDAHRAFVPAMLILMYLSTPDVDR